MSPMPAIYEPIYELEEALKEFPEIECPTFHHFKDGVYIREFHLPAGCTVTSYIHKYSNFTIIAGGECIFNTRGEAHHMVAPYMFPTDGGDKRAVHAITDCIILTVHRTEASSKEEAESVLVTNDWTALPEPIKAKLEELGSWPSE